MSRRPGIGRNYFEENKEKIYELDEIINAKGKSVKPPHYYDRLMQEENPELMTKIKRNREEILNNRLEVKMSQTALTLQEQLEIEKTTAEELFKKTQKKGKFINV